MNFPETLIAAVIFGISAVSSLQVWTASAAWSQGGQRHQEWLLQIDADMQRTESRLRRLKAELVGGMGCVDAIRLMVKSIELPEISMAPEIKRKLEVRQIPGSQSDQLLVLHYQVNSPTLTSSLVRQRHWTAQAFDLCHGTGAGVSP